MDSIKAYDAESYEVSPVEVDDWDNYVLGMFWESVDVRESTLKTYRRMMSRFVSWVHDEGISLAQVTPAHLKAYKTHLEQTCNGNTVASYMVPVKSFYRFAFDEWGLKNPTVHLKIKKRAQTHAKDALTEDEVKAMFAYVDEHATDGLTALRDRAMLLLSATCALRTIEVSRADIADRETVQGVPVLWVHGKARSSKDEYVTLSPRVCDAIDEYLAARGETDPASPMFISHGNRSRGGRVCVHTISRTEKAIMKAVGIDSPRKTAHSLRHTAITRALEKGATLQEAQEFARHRNPKTTEIYAHNLDRLHNRAAAFAADYDD